MTYRPIEAERTALYRIYDEAGALLYIGITRDFGMRWQKHAAQQPWWPQVKRQVVDWYDSRPEARKAEIAAIGAEQPKHNKYDRFGAATSPEVEPPVIARVGTCEQQGVPCRRRPIGCGGESGIGYPCLLLSAA